MPPIHRGGTTVTTTSSVVPSADEDSKKTKAGDDDTDMLESDFLFADRERILFVDSFMRHRYTDFLTTCDYDAVIFNYSGSFLNDSYATWKTALQAMKECSIAIEEPDAATYVKWRLNTCTTLDAFVFAVSPTYKNMDPDKWIREYRPMLHGAYQRARSTSQGHISLAPGLLTFIDMLDLMGIPWFVKLQDDLESAEEAIDEITLLTSCVYVCAEKLTSKVLCPYAKTSYRMTHMSTFVRHNDSVMYDNGRQMMSAIECLKMVKHTLHPYIPKNERILWFVDNTKDCQIAQRLCLHATFTAWGSCDHRVALHEYHIQMIDPVRGYDSVLTCQKEEQKEEEDEDGGEEEQQQQEKKTSENKQKEKDHIV